MDQVFILKLILSFLIGGAWVTTAIHLADKFGTKVGGIITGLPSTALLSLFFIAWTQSPAVSAEATTIIPIIGAVNSLFLLVYISMVRKNFWMALGSSFLVWGGLSLTLVLLDFNAFSLSILIYAVVAFLSFLHIEKGIKVKSKQLSAVKNTLRTLVFRGLFSGGIIVLAVIMGKIGGPLLGGMFAMFPAMFTGTLLITYFSHGSLFSSAMMKVALLSASSVVLYAILVRFTYVRFGLFLGTLISIVVSFTYAFIIHTVLVKRIS
ncbi:MAG: hypothetical protein GTO17_06495 [Candidatus Aminicenantes bacterium]|nr:hypothetical protein [Candidatus Aminicenantes bacterium]